MQNLVGKGKEISVASLASSLGCPRQSVLYQVKQPLKKWPLERIMIVADLLNYPWKDLVDYAMEYEKDFTTPLMERQKRRVKVSPGVPQDI